MTLNLKILLKYEEKMKNQRWKRQLKCKDKRGKRNEKKKRKGNCKS